MRTLLALILAAAASAAPAQTIVWEKWDPIAVRTTRTAPVALTLQTSGTVSGIRLDYAGGGSLTLTPNGSGMFSASVPAANVLAGYDSTDVNHNFVGYLRLLDSGGQTIATYNSFINVLDSAVPPVYIRDLGGNARAGVRIVNLYRPAIGINDVKSAVQQLYGYFSDDYDFVMVVYAMPSYPANRYHFGVRNDVSGIGSAIFDQSHDYGSAGRLQGITVFPVDFFFDGADTGFSHELAHQWIMFLKNPSLQPGPHWPPSTMARGIMGFNIPGSNVGGQFPWEITAVTSTTARLKASTVTNEFDDFDLYLMGLLPPSSVAPGIVVEGTACDGCVLPSTPLAIADVIAVNGPRTPDVTTSRKSFRIATVVISRDRLLSDDEMNVLEYFAARAEAMTPLPYTSGFVRGTTNPFYVATRGLGRVDLQLLHAPKRRAVKR